MRESERPGISEIKNCEWKVSSRDYALHNFMYVNYKECDKDIKRVTEITSKWFYTILFHLFFRHQIVRFTFNLDGFYKNSKAF